MNHNKAIEGILDKLDSEQRDAFLSVSVEDQRLILFSIGMSNSNRLAVVEKRQIDFEKDIREYRSRREKREDQNGEEVMNTTQKIMKAIAEADAKRFNTWVYFRDRILPNILSPAILVLLYLIFAQIKPR